MNTTFLKYQKKKSELVCSIQAAFSQAKSFRQEKGVDRAIRRVNDYYKLNRGILNIDIGGSYGGVTSNDTYDDQPQAAKDAGIACKSLVIHMDNISNMLETWMATINDALLRVTKPHDVQPSVIPGKTTNLNQEQVADSVQDIILDQIVPFSEGDEDRLKEILSDLIVDKNSGHDFIREVRDDVHNVVLEHRQEIAQETADAIDLEMTDQIQESNYADVMRKVNFSFARDDYAILKAPQYVFDYRDQITDTAIEEVKGEFLFLEHINIINYYAAPDTKIDNHGSYEFEVSSMTFSELEDAKTCEGFIEKAINDVQDFFKDCERDWLTDGWDASSIVEKYNSFDTIPVLKGRIKTSYDSLKDHGLVNKDDLKTKNINYDLTFWMIGDFLIYGAVSLNRKPVMVYKVGGWQRIGDHVYQSKGITSIALPYQLQIDKSYRHLIKNEEYSALGIWGYNKRKIDMDDFKPEDLVGGIALPVKTSVQDGGNDRPIFNVRADSNVAAILTSISHYQTEMEEKSQISSFSVGVASRLGSSFRTTGLGNLNQANANKLTLLKIVEMETRFIKPFVTDLSRVIMWTSNNPKIKSGPIDVQVLSITDIIRQGDESENIDFFIQNIIGILNAIPALEAQGMDVSGIKNLIARYAEAKGFDADDVFPESTTQALGQGIQDVTLGNVPLDGRSQSPIDSNARI